MVYILFYSTVVGFDKSVIHFGPNDRGARIGITAQILLRTPGVTAPRRYDIRLLPNPLPDSKFMVYGLTFKFFKDIGNFLPSLPSGRPATQLPYTYTLQYALDGNNKALEPSVTVTYDIVASSAIPLGAIMVYQNVSITADDIDSKYNDMKIYLNLLFVSNWSETSQHVMLWVTSSGRLFCTSYNHTRHNSS